MRASFKIEFTDVAYASAVEMKLFTLDKPFGLDLKSIVVRTLLKGMQFLLHKNVINTEVKTVKDERWLWAFFMILVVFFGRFAMQGLSSDAAMYAGLSRSILENGHWWAPRGVEMFPVFFEHPPYVFQWGAMVLSLLGQSDGAARAIGAIPGALGLLFLFTWIWRRHSWELAFWTLLLLLSFGHYTKYASTVMLEAPLSLGAVLFAIGTFEFFFRVNIEKRWLLVACVGALVSTAAKGVVGFLFCAGLTPFVLFFSNRDQSFSLRKATWFLACGISAAAPLLLWGVMTWDAQHGTSLLGRYLHEQVFRSYSTDRGHPEMYAQSWAWWSYPLVVIKYGWPWWWTVPLGAFWIFKRPPLQETFLKSWTSLSLVFFLVLLAAFSTSHVRLPHYIHPTYLLLAPIGGYAAWMVLRRFVNLSESVGRKLRWISLGVVAFLMPLMFRGTTNTGNRGQAFATLAKQINPLPRLCDVYMPASESDLYQSETYFIWYLKGRHFHQIPDEDYRRSRAEFLQSRIWWSPAKGELLIHPSCEVASVR